MKELYIREPQRSSFMTSCQVCQVLEAVLAFNRLCH